MIDKQLLGVLSLVMETLGVISYVRSILKQKTKPHVFSWGVWSLLLIIAFCAQWSEGAGAGAWVTGYCAFLYLVLALLALKHGEKNITRGDWLALTGALAAIPVWQLTHDAFWAIVMVTSIDVLAYFPTFRKSYGKPYEESCVVHVFGLLKWIPALFALDTYSATTMLYQIFMIMADSALVTMIVVRRRMTGKTA